MKIAEVVANFPPYFGGIGNSAYQTSIGLKNLGNDVTVYTSNYPKKKYKYLNGLIVKRLNYLLRIGNAPLLLGLFKMKKTDIIHLHYPFYFGGEIILLLKIFKGSKYVISYHMDVVGTGLLKYVFKIHQKTIMKLILKNACKILVSSMDYANNSELANIKSIKEKIVEIPYGVELKRFRKTKRDYKFLVKYDLTKNNKFILFVGGMDRAHYFKGIEILLKAFSLAKTSNTKLILIGDGELKNKYMNYAKELGLKDKVCFTGRVADDNLPNFYQICEFLVLPSTDKGEAFGLVTLEAMASGKAVIVSNLPGVRTLVEENKNGLLSIPGSPSDLAKKINYLLSNPQISKQFGKNGRKKVINKYNWDIINKKIEFELSKIN